MRASSEVVTSKESMEYLSMPASGPGLIDGQSFLSCPQLPVMTLPGRNVRPLSSPRLKKLFSQVKPLKTFFLYSATLPTTRSRKSQPDSHSGVHLLSMFPGQVKGFAPVKPMPRLKPMPALRPLPSCGKACQSVAHHFCSFGGRTSRVADAWSMPAAAARSATEIFIVKA